MEEVSAEEALSDLQCRLGVDVPVRPLPAGRVRHQSDAGSLRWTEPLLAHRRTGNTILGSKSKTCHAKDTSG